MRAAGLRVTRRHARQGSRAADRRAGTCTGTTADANEFRYDEIADALRRRSPSAWPTSSRLTGDAVDNIPGVPGVGPKTAAALLIRYATLGMLYADLDAVAQLPLRGAATSAAKLRDHRESAFLARPLTRIHCDVPMQADQDRSRAAARRWTRSAVLHRHGFGACCAPGRAHRGRRRGRGAVTELRLRAS